MALPQSVEDLVYDIICAEVLAYEVVKGGPKLAGKAMAGFAVGVWKSLISADHPAFPSDPAEAARQWLNWWYAVDGQLRPEWVLTQ